MRYPLDTNIISNFTKPAPSGSLIAWLAEQSDEDLFIASQTVAEIRRGVLKKPAGKRRDQLDAWFSVPLEYFVLENEALRQRRRMR